MYLWRQTRRTRKYIYDLIASFFHTVLLLREILKDILYGLLFFVFFGKWLFSWCLVCRCHQGKWWPPQRRPGGVCLQPGVPAFTNSTLLVIAEDRARTVYFWTAVYLSRPTFNLSRSCRLSRPGEPFNSLMSETAIKIFKSTIDLQ